MLPPLLQVLNKPKDAIRNKFGRRGIMSVIGSFGLFLVVCSIVYIVFLYSEVDI